ncbi:O-methyltransferase [Gangjinia marincola]|uniref:O-methyltransferase n=1 Tax=Gangjinia marincola TaxID=578463 RepID=A0ABN1MIY8_9FLAO
MEFISQQLDEYVVQHSQPEPQLLQELSRETWLKVLQPRMLSGHYQGRLLSLLSKLIAPTTILEIGTYTGYSALCLAEGLSQNGTLHTIDINEELSHIQEKYFEKSAFAENIIRHTGNALEIIPTLKTSFDLIFIDADKQNYSAYFDLIMDHIHPGSVIISDNVLWSGKVIKKVQPDDQDTQALIDYNKKINTDPRVETVLLPIRDGLTITRVK